MNKYVIPSTAEVSFYFLVVFQKIPDQTIY
jgi:hypothetical protein